MSVLQIIAYLPLLQPGPHYQADMSEVYALQHCQTSTKITVQLVLVKDIIKPIQIISARE